nr:MAG TPA: hypothetical protein [Caudoviricetes sp.]
MIQVLYLLPKLRLNKLETTVCSSPLQFLKLTKSRSDNLCLI